ncbi:MAG: I78 family peptidase inhibitor [Ramlibacter sp.]
MVRETLALLALAALLGGCAQDPPQVPLAPPPPVIAPGQCDASAAQFAVGQPVAPQLIEEARSRARAQRVRTLRPGQMVTMEFDAGRLSLHVDAQERVVRANCG